MAPNGVNGMHNDAYQTDAYNGTGPLGRQSKKISRLLGAECGTVTFDSRGRIVTICVAPAAPPRLLLLNPRTLKTIAAYTLPGTTSASQDLNLTTGGAYFYLDDKDRAVLPTRTGKVMVVADEGTRFRPVATYDPQIAADDGITAALPDWTGRLWFITPKGVVGTIDPATGAVRKITIAGEAIANSFAVDESGGVFIVTDHALYRFDADACGGPSISWRESYDRGARVKPGQFSQGSGTTPTLIGSAASAGGGYIAITDNADPRMHVLVFARGRHSHSKVCSQTVFAPGRGADENSLIAVGGDLIAENNYGTPSTDLYSLVPTLLGARFPDTAPGLARVHVDYKSRTCSLAWTNNTERVPTVVSKASLGSGLLYTYTHPSASELAYRPRAPRIGGAPDAWYLTALDLRTGKRVWSQYIGSGLTYNNLYAPITLGPDGSAYVGTTGGLVRVSDRS